MSIIKWLTSRTVCEFQLKVARINIWLDAQLGQPLVANGLPLSKCFSDRLGSLQSGLDQYLMRERLSTGDDPGLIAG